MLKHWRAAAVLAACAFMLTAILLLGADHSHAAPLMLATTPVSAWFENAYIKGATHKLQSQGFLLKGTTREPDRVQAKTVIWRIAGRGEAVEMPDIPEQAEVMNADRSTVQGDLKDYQAADWVRHPDINKMSENEQEIVQQTAAFALGRKFDRVHFDEFDATSLAAGNIIGNGTAVTDLLSLDYAEAVIVGQGVIGPMELFCPLPSVAFKQLCLWKQFSDADYVGPDYPLARMTMRKKWGFVTYFVCPNEMFTFDTGVSATAWQTADWFQSYMWVKSAVGFGTNYEMQSRITWENRYTAYFANNWMPALAKVILPEALVRVKFDMPTSLAVPADTKLAA